LIISRKGLLGISHIHHRRLHHCRCCNLLLRKTHIHHWGLNKGIHHRGLLYISRSYLGRRWLLHVHCLWRRWRIVNVYDLRFRFYYDRTLRRISAFFTFNMMVTSYMKISSALHTMRHVIGFCLTTLIAERHKTTPDLRPAENTDQNNLDFKECRLHKEKN